MHELNHYQIAQLWRAERMREAERFRRAAEARSHARRRPAAPRQRRFAFVRLFFSRPREA